MTQRVLWVDDNPVSVARLLNEKVEGFSEIDAARSLACWDLALSTEEAMHAFNKTTYDFVVLDADFPDTFPDELARVVREQFRLQRQGMPYDTDIGYEIQRGELGRIHCYRTRNGIRLLPLVQSTPTVFLSSNSSVPVALFKYGFDIPYYAKRGWTRQKVLDDISASLKRWYDSTINEVAPSLDVFEGRVFTASDFIRTYLTSQY